MEKSTLILTEEIQRSYGKQKICPHCGKDIHERPERISTIHLKYLDNKKDLRYKLTNLNSSSFNEPVLFMGVLTLLKESFKDFTKNAEYLVEIFIQFVAIIQSGINELYKIPLL